MKLNYDWFAYYSRMPCLITFGEVCVHLIMGFKDFSIKKRKVIKSSHLSEDCLFPSLIGSSFMFEDSKNHGHGRTCNQDQWKVSGNFQPLFTCYALCSYCIIKCSAQTQRSRLVIVTRFKWMDHKKSPFNSIKKIYIMDIFVISEVSSHLGRKLVLNSLL